VLLPTIGAKGAAIAAIATSTVLTVLLAQSAARMIRPSPGMTTVDA